MSWKYTQNQTNADLEYTQKVRKALKVCAAPVWKFELAKL